MSVPLGTTPEEGRGVWWRDTSRPNEQVWLQAVTLRVRPNGSLDLEVDGGPRGTFVVRRVANGIKPGQWCGWSDDLWRPREGGELARTTR